MKNIVLLTELSPASLHIALYAAALARQYHSSRLVLCHTSETGNSKGNETGLEHLKALHTKLLNLVHTNTAIHYRSEAGLPATIVNKIALQEQADLVISGLKKQEGLYPWMADGELQNVPDTCLFPVLLVPAIAAITAIDKIILLCDFEDAQETFEQSGLLHILRELHAAFVVLHVEKPGIGLAPGISKEIPIVQAMLKPYSPEFFFLESEDPPAAIARFAAEQQASVIIIIRKRKGLYSHLFHTSITNHLSITTKVPLLVLHATKNYPVRKL